MPLMPQSNPLTQISAVHGRMQMKWLVGYARWLKKTIGDATMFTGHKFYFHTSRFAKSHLPEWKLTDEYEGKIAKYHPGMLQLMNAGLAKNIQRTVKTYQWEDGHNAFALTTLGICSAFAGIGLAGTLKSTVMAVETQIGWRSAGTLAWNSARGNLFRRAWTRAAGTLLEFEAATVGFTVGTDAFMTPIAGVPTFDKFSNNLMVNGVVFGALDIAGFGLLKVFRMNPVKGAKVLEGTSDAALGGLFKEASVWGKESALWNARYAEKMAEGASTGFLGTFKNNIVGFGKYMGEALPGSLRALRNLPQALRGTGAGLKALNSRQLIKSATGITGGTSGFLYSMLHYMSVVSLLHHSDIYLEPMDMAEPIPEDQKPSFLETAVHLAIIMAGARGMGNGDFFLRRVLEKHHDAEVAKVVGEIRTGLENIHQIGVRQGDKVGGLRQSWNDDAQRNGGHYRPLERLVQLLDVVRDVSQLKAAELRLLDHKVGYEETGVDRQTEAIQETKTAIAGRLLFECLTSIAARGDVARDGTIAISRDQLQTIRREGEIFNRLFGSRVRFEQVGSPRGGKTYYRFTSIKDGKSAGTFLSDSVFTPYPGQSRSNVDMDNLRKVRPGVYTPKTEGPKGDRPTTPGGFLTTNLL